MHVLVPRQYQKYGTIQNVIIAIPMLTKYGNAPKIVSLLFVGWMLIVVETIIEQFMFAAQDSLAIRTLFVKS